MYNNLLDYLKLVLSHPNLLCFFFFFLEGGGVLFPLMFLLISAV